MKAIDRIEAGWNAGIDWSRTHSRGFDHFWLARQRYNQNYGPRLAAATAYYGFFAAFALGLVAYSILGFVLAGNHAFVNSADNYLRQNLPFLNPTAIQNARKTVAVIGLIGLVFTGIAWVDGVRSAQRAMWQFDQQPGNFFIRRLIDLGMLFGLGLLLALSLWVTSGVHDLVRAVLDWIAPTSASQARRDADNGILQVFGQIGSGLVNLLLAAALLIGVPRVRVSVRRIITPVLLVGLGLTGLTSIGRFYVDHTANNPAYRLAGAAVGLLVFLNLFGQLMLFGAALAATSRHGAVRDLAAGAPPAGDDRTTSTIQT